MQRVPVNSVYEAQTLITDNARGTYGVVSPQLASAIAKAYSTRLPTIGHERRLTDNRNAYLVRALGPYVFQQYELRIY